MGASKLLDGSCCAATVQRPWWNPLYLSLQGSQVVHVCIKATVFPACWTNHGHQMSGHVPCCQNLFLSFWLAVELQSLQTMSLARPLQAGWEQQQRQVRASQAQASGGGYMDPTACHQHHRHCQQRWATIQTTATSPRSAKGCNAAGGLRACVLVV